MRAPSAAAWAFPDRRNNRRRLYQGRGAGRPDGEMLYAVVTKSPAGLDSARRTQRTGDAVSGGESTDGGGSGSGLPRRHPHRTDFSKPTTAIDILRHVYSGPISSHRRDCSMGTLGGSGRAVNIGCLALWPDMPVVSIATWIRVRRVRYLQRTDCGSTLGEASAISIATTLLLLSFC